MEAEAREAVVAVAEVEMEAEAREAVVAVAERTTWVKEVTTETEVEEVAVKVTGEVEAEGVKMEGGAMSRNRYENVLLATQQERSRSKPKSRQQLGSTSESLSSDSCTSNFFPSTIHFNSVRDVETRALLESTPKKEEAQAYFKP